MTKYNKSPNYKISSITKAAMILILLFLIKYKFYSLISEYYALNKNLLNAFIFISLLFLMINLLRKEYIVLKKDELIISELFQTHTIYFTDVSLIKITQTRGYNLVNLPFRLNLIINIKNDKINIPVNEYENYMDFIIQLKTINLPLKISNTISWKYWDIK